MNTYLSPIENPKALGMKLAYYFTKKKFGKVLTSLKVHSARLPMGFGMFYAKVSELDKKLQLPTETALLIRQQVAQLNICHFCIDASRSAAIVASLDVTKFDALSGYASSSLFPDAEKAALDYATELTKEKKVSPNTFAALLHHYSEREVCEIVYLVASEHLYNLTNMGLNVHSDMLCDITKNKKR